MPDSILALPFLVAQRNPAGVEWSCRFTSTSRGRRVANAPPLIPHDAEGEGSEVNMAKLKPAKAPDMAPGDARKAVIRLSSHDVNVMFLMFVNGLVQYGSMAQDYWEHSPTKCLAEKGIRDIQEAVRTFRPLVDKLPYAPAKDLFSDVEAKLLENIAMMLARLEHTHANEVEDLTQVQ